MTLQFFLISPCEPVRGLISPILIIAAAKSELNVLASLLYVMTSESVDPLLYNSWSEYIRPSKF